MVPARIPRIKQVLGRVTVEEAREMAREALAQRDSDSVKAIVDGRFGERFHHAPSR
jgi:phosphoenolpyruvate-protein kinase (PTS system EI component)